LAERLLNRIISSRRELRDAIRAATLTRAQAFKLFVDTSVAEGRACNSGPA
jgi:hypothetical protein